MTRHLIERPAGDAQAGDVDLMRAVLDLDDDENMHRIGHEPWPAAGRPAQALSRKIELAPWLQRTT